MANRRTSGDSARGATRLLVAERDGWRCQSCGTPVHNGDPTAPDYMHAGHILDHADGGRPTIDNLRCECRKCNQTMGGINTVHRTRSKIDALTKQNEQLINTINAMNADAPIPTARQRVSTTQRTRDAKPVTGVGFSGGALLSGRSLPPISNSDRAAFPGNGVFNGNSELGGANSGEYGGSSGGNSPAGNPVIPVSRTPGRHSAISDFSGISWMNGLLRVPADATWPRFMSGPHPLAVGSYGQRFERWWKANPWSPLYRAPRWWQRLVARRVLEHDAMGNLVWDEWLLTLARQLGKSVILQGLALWRMDVGPKLFGEPAEVLHVANRIKISREIQAPARAWARGRIDLGWAVREMAGSEAVTHPNGSRWQCAAQGSTYGFTASVAMIDEAWEINADTVTNGIEPTVLERAAHQLGLISTAHPNATNLFVDRRRDAMAGDDVLLIEWSAPPWLPDEDRSGWRMASPSWTPGRERAIAKALSKARTTPGRPGEPDPIKSWRAQYLNQWPEKAADMLGLSGERLLPEGSWADLAADVDTVGDLAVAIEDHAGLATAVSVAGATADGRIGVNGFSLASRDDAFAFVTAVVQAQSVQAVFIGPTLVDVGDVELLRPLVRVEAVNAADTKGSLALLRQLCSRREVAHPVGVDLDNQVERCRVVAGPAGLRIVSIDRFDLVKSAAWAVAAIERQRQFAPTVY